MSAALLSVENWLAAPRHPAELQLHGYTGSIAYGPEASDEDRDLLDRFDRRGDRIPSDLRGKARGDAITALAAFGLCLGIHPNEIVDCCEKAAVDSGYDMTRQQIVEAVQVAIDHHQRVAPEAAPTAELATPDEPGHPFEKLNRNYAFILVGGRQAILWETTDAEGRDDVRVIAPEAFHADHAAEEIQVGKKSAPVTAEWMRWKGRRSYAGLVFMPEQEAPARFYNLWTGFKVPPAVGLAPNRALDMWLDHIHKNVANARAEDAKWLIGFFAHMVQRPWEKPLVAAVLQGGKGVGKNAAIEPVLHLLGNHGRVEDSPRMLTGNFNSHLERCLCIAFDEAFWSGDKQAEGRLKGLITGTFHTIELKGYEPYRVRNLTRVIILGNEQWLVPASVDERRYAVFRVGEGRKQDRGFFGAMVAGMQSGGYAMLLRYLLDFDLDTVDLGQAPDTEALRDQKRHSMSLAQDFIDEMLAEGRVPGGEFTEPGQSLIKVKGLTYLPNCLEQWARQKGVRHEKRRDARMELKKLLPEALPGTYAVPTKKHGETQQVLIGPLDQARAEWARYLAGGRAHV
jgi:hypothetical protein